MIFTALMEYHRSDDKLVASRIFERGLDVFGSEIEYVLRYLSFLISINDDNSMSLYVIPNFIPLITIIFQMHELYLSAL